MKIAIVGCGLTGLSTYVALRKYLPDADSHEITIYESHGLAAERLANSVNSQELAAPAGGTIGLSANGMKVMRDLDINVYDEIIHTGFAYSSLRLRSSHGWDLSIVSRSKYEGDVFVMISRENLWKILRNAVPDVAVVIKKVTDVVKRGRMGNSRPIIKFRDGDSIEADLVIGADGVRSTVRKEALGSEDSTYTPVFSGKCGIWGFTSMQIPKEVTEKQSVVIVMGSNGTFGYSSHHSASDDQLTWWASYETTEPLQQKELDLKFVTNLLHREYRSWKETNVQNIIGRASASFVYPIWILPKLPTWGDSGVVLLGDAAHAMSPDIAQGTSQAFEDAQAYAMLLGSLLGKGLSLEETVDLSAKGIFECRIPRVEKVKALSARATAKDMKRNTIVQYLIYFCVWLLPKLASMRDLIYTRGLPTNDIIHDWNVVKEVEKVVGKVNHL